MKIKTRLSLQFTILVFGILLIFSNLVYFFWETSQRTKFRENLLRRAKNVSSIIFSEGNPNLRMMRRLNAITFYWREEEIIVADSALNIIYSYERNYLTNDELNSHLSKSGPNYFSIGKKDGVCFITDPEFGFFYIFVSAFDKTRSDNLIKLRGILFYSILISLFISALSSYFFSKKAVKPISEMNSTIKRINSQKLGERLAEGKGNDEIEQLAITFNKMLSDIESTFRSQTEFISNASHELRTPLAVMISESDYIINNLKSEKDALSQIVQLHHDLKNLNSKTNSLLELATLSNGRQSPFSEIMLDEIIFEAVRQIKVKYPARRIASKVDYPENELLIMGNQGLMNIVFTNLLDNACKFSTGEVFINIVHTEKTISLSIADTGIGIPAGEVESILLTFKRASNAKYINGFGIGLSLVKKILSLHDATMNIESIENKGTTVTLTFYRIG